MPESLNQQKRNHRKAARELNRAMDKLVGDAIQAALNDKDADVLNIVDEGVRLDPHLFALTLLGRATGQERAKGG